MSGTTTERRSIAELRLTRGLSRPQLALALGASTLSIKSWELLFVRPNARNLRRLAEFFEVGEEELEIAPYREPGRPVTSSQSVTRSAAKTTST